MSIFKQLQEKNELKSSFFFNLGKYSNLLFCISYDIVTQGDAQKLMLDYFIRENKKANEINEDFLFKTDLQNAEIPALPECLSSSSKIFFYYVYNFRSGFDESFYTEIIFEDKEDLENRYTEAKENFNEALEESQTNERIRLKSLKKMIEIQQKYIDEARTKSLN